MPRSSASRAGTVYIRLVPFLFALAAAPLTTAGALADPDLNCDAYAQAAVSQQAENLQRNCGFTGKGWSSDFIGHRNWCLTPGVGIMAVSQEDHRRAEQLKTCQATKLIKPIILKDCNTYAQKAVDQQAANLQNKCGFAGGGWSTEFVKHRDWCASAHVTPEMLNKETGARTVALLGCVVKN